MKAINWFLLVFILTFAACDTTPKEGEEGDATTAAIDSLDQTELTQVEPVPAEDYALFFAQAVTALEQGDQAATLAHLQSGINLLSVEGTALEGDEKHKMDSAIAELEAAKLQLEQGQLQGATDLKQLILKVQANTPHRLLADAPVEKTGVQE